jgi:hypothetical protein
MKKRIESRVPSLPPAPSAPDPAVPSRRSSLSACRRELFLSVSADLGRGKLADDKKREEKNGPRSPVLFRQPMSAVQRGRYMSRERERRPTSTSANSLAFLKSLISFTCSSCVSLNTKARPPGCRVRSVARPRQLKLSSVR